MPGGDRTGPLGTGAGTGRRRNNCIPQGTVSRPFYGRRYGRGSGYGFRNRYYLDNLTDNDLLDEKKILEARIKSIDQQLQK